MNEQALINAMTQKGHSVETAKGAIAGRGMEGLWNEYMGGSTGGGGSVPDLNFTPTKSPLEGIAGSMDSLLQSYTGAIQNQTPGIELMDQARGKYGIPQLNQAYFGGLEQFDALGNQIRGVPESIKQGSQESILTQGQLGRMSEARQAPLLEQQGLLGQSLGRMGEMLAKAEQFAQTDVGLMQAEQAKQLMPWARAFSNAELIAGLSMTAWSAENAMNLDVLLAKFNAGQQLTLQERDHMNQLALQENSFANTLKQLQEQMKAPMLVGEGSSVYNPVTGKVEFKAPKTYAPGTGSGTDLITLWDQWQKSQGN